MVKSKRLSRPQTKLVYNEKEKEIETELIKKSKERKDEKNKEKKIIIEDMNEPIQMTNDTNMLILTESDKKVKLEKKAAEQERINKKKPKKLTNKERKKLEKVLERKEKTSKRSELLEKLSKVQINASELNMYSSVKDIGKKAKNVKIPNNNNQSNDGSEANGTSKRMRNVNAISGSNKKQKIEESEIESCSTDTDNISTDSDIDEQEINKAINNFNNNNNVVNDNINKIDKKETKVEKNEIIEINKENKNKDNLRKTKYVHVNRREEIQKTRDKLPIITEEQSIMEKINENDIVILSGETGSGKTTQVPQFLYEAGYAEDGKIIGITEPRRVAAISMSKRVNDEMNFNEEDAIISYQIRYEGNYSPGNTKIKFMTDGVLLKEVQMDFMLNNYSVIIIDEAHERSVYTDILIGLLSRIVPLRNKKNNPLKLIIMSATLRVEDFTENRQLFKLQPPVMKIESRQFPVSIHFNKHTYSDYMSEALRKVCKIHKRLPDGGILVFLTGQQEVNVLCSRLRALFPQKNQNIKNNEQNLIKKSKNNPREKEDNKTKKQKSKNKKKSDTIDEKLTNLPTINLDSYSTMPLDEESELYLQNNQNKEDEDYDKIFDIDNDDMDELLSDYEDEENDRIESKETEKNPNNINNSTIKPLYVLPLYSLLSSEKQARVFEKVPENCRLCVVATNVAETSLTIPNIKYVVDSGKIKMKFYDKVTGVSTFRVSWTSKASAEQRSGRAGRTSPGHCYRLYSSAVFNDEFPLFAEPEIKRKPVEDLILQMKDLGIDRIINFPFPTAPSEESIRWAENLLIQLGALQIDKTRIKNLKDEQVTRITDLGKTMSCFPINPRYSKMLTLASQQTIEKNIISYIICLISGLSVPELFIDGETTIKSKIPKNLSSDNKTKNNDENNNEQKEELIKVKYSSIRQTWLDSMPNSHTHLLGDMMLILVAMGAVEYEQYKHINSKEKSNKLEYEKNNEYNNCIKFCEKYGIRYKAIVEARKLRKQLVNTVNIIFPNLNLIIDPMMMPPTQEQAKLIRQIILSGMVDRIAKKYEYIINDKNGKEIKNAYQSLMLEDPVFIHPSSVLFKELPPFVSYVEMVETSKLYMKGVCSIEAKWLPIYLSSQCSFEKPIVNESNENYKDFEPRFDQTKGLVMCHRSCTFDRVMWPIKPVEVEFPTSLELYKWFARFFLEGKVCSFLQKYENVLLASPSTMLKSWAKLQPRTEALLNMLISNKCYTKEKLIDLWKNKNDYLLNEYCLWIPESLHFDIRLKWPPIDEEIKK